MKQKEKEELIGKLFECDWNYAWGNMMGGRLVIHRFYENNGWKGLYEFVKGERDRLTNEFERYYSKNLLSILEILAKKCRFDDFEKYILKNFNINFNRQNFYKLREYGLLKHFYDFSDNFRGDIVTVYKVKDYSIMECEKRGETSYYSVGDFTNSFGRLEEALLHSMFKGKYFDTLQTLLKTVNEKTF